MCCRDMGVGVIRREVPDIRLTWMRSLYRDMYLPGLTISSRSDAPSQLSVERLPEARSRGLPYMIELDTEGNIIFTTVVFVALQYNLRYQFSRERVRRMHTDSREGEMRVRNLWLKSPIRC